MGTLMLRFAVVGMLKFKSDRALMILTAFFITLGRSKSYLVFVECGLSSDKFTLKSSEELRAKNIPAFGHSCIPEAKCDNGQIEELKYLGFSSPNFKVGAH